jgi:glycerol-3-phosphate acyltransferase PlsY
MVIIVAALLATAAFGLAAVPFSLLVGRWLLGKDIRHYGDGNPGAANVFRAGGQKAGYLAVFLDVGKGAPFVLLASSSFDLPSLSIVAVGVSAVLGHAFSPFLHWRGGKSVAVTFGVLLALPAHEVLLAFIACMVVGALFIETDSWAVVLAAAGSLAYLAFTRADAWEILLMLCLLLILVFKHRDDLRTVPGLRGRLVRWVLMILRGPLSMI